MTMVRGILFTICLAFAPFCEAGDSDASKALEQLKSLAGSWEGTAQWAGARSGSYSIGATYYVTGNGSALVEDLITEKAPTMTSVYHLDGNDLRLTHFCGTQNQPRLKAKRIDLEHKAFDFEFVDITNLKSPDAPHVHGLEIRLLDPNHITVTFLFRAANGESRELLNLNRVQNKPGANS
jgi:hypothetical protein